MSRGACRVPLEWVAGSPLPDVGRVGRTAARAIIATFAKTSPPACRPGPGGWPASACRCPPPPASSSSRTPGPVCGQRRAPTARRRRPRCSRRGGPAGRRRASAGLRCADPGSRAAGDSSASERTRAMRRPRGPPAWRPARPRRCPMARPGTSDARLQETHGRHHVARRSDARSSPGSPPCDPPCPRRSMASATNPRAASCSPRRRPVGAASVQRRRHQHHRGRRPARRAPRPSPASCTPSSAANVMATRRRRSPGSARSAGEAEPAQTTRARVTGSSARSSRARRGRDRRATRARRCE